MAKLLLLYSTQEGQTLKIAERTRDIAKRAGWSVDMRAVPVTGETIATDADAVLLAASVHVGRHDPAAEKLVSSNGALFTRLPGAFISVSLSAGGERRTAAEGYASDFLESTGWRPAMQTQIAGALRYRSYGLLKRMLLRQIARSNGLPTDTSRDHEFTDWAALEAFVIGFLASLAMSPPAAVQTSLP